MKRNKRSGINITRIITFMLAFFVVLATFGIIMKYTAGFTTSFKSFYVTANGKDVMSVGNGFTTNTVEPLKVNVKYAFSGKSEQKGYSILIVPNKVKNEDFDFCLDGNYYSFQAEEDLTAGFDIEKSETSFTLKPKGGLIDVLKGVYPDVQEIKCQDKGYIDMFTLIVTSYNGESSVKVNFSLATQVTGVNLDKGVYEYLWV